MLSVSNRIISLTGIHCLKSVIDCSASVSSSKSVVSKMLSGFPYFLEGTVDHGFGRGSKELGIPTANFSEKDVLGFSSELKAGIYLGWAQIDNGQINKMVMSVGWNPFYKNEKKAVEVHILAKFPSEFYGAHMKAIALEYLRPEKDFPSLDSLISAIKADIAAADERLDSEIHLKYKNHSFFSTA